MKVISFSLWGNDSKYTTGALKNAELAAKFYPDWECWFYLRGCALADLHDHPNCKVIMVNKAANWTGMFDRFAPASAEPNVEAMISRDCDSRLSEREAVAVNEWLVSGKGFHRMFDHPWHAGVPILGGMWGVKAGVIPDMVELMAAWNQEDRWQTDQEFLRDVIWPKVMHNTFTHDAFFGQGRVFSTPRRGLEFVGATHTHEDLMIPEQMEALHAAQMRRP